MEAEQQAAAAWAVGMEPAPDEAVLLETVAGPLASISGDSGVTPFFHLLAGRDPPITTVSEIKMNLTNSELQSAARGTVKQATLRTLGNLLQPGGFIWPVKTDADVAQPAKRKRGSGARNNQPTVGWAEQLRLEGVEALCPATFKFAPHVFDGVPKKGEKARLNGYEQVLFDNTWLAMSQIPQLRSYLRPRGIIEATEAQWEEDLAPYEPTMNSQGKTLGLMEKFITYTQNRRNHAKPMKRLACS